MNISKAKNKKYEKGLATLSSSPVPMSIKEARKKLGVKYKQMTDEQIEHLVYFLSQVAKQSVQDLGSKIIY